MGVPVGTHNYISGILNMTSMFTSLAVKQDQAEEFWAKKQKMAFFTAFTWPLLNYDQCGLLGI